MVEQIKKHALASLILCLVSSARVAANRSKQGRSGTPDMSNRLRLVVRAMDSCDLNMQDATAARARGSVTHCVMNESI